MNASITMPRQCYSWFFWGLLLAILDLKLNDVDLLPDFLGYVGITLAASRISSVAPAFQSVVLPSIALAVLDLAGLFMAGGLPDALGYVDAILDCLMMWFLLGAVAIDCRAHAHPDLAASAHIRRQWYVGLNVAIHIISLLASGNRDLGILLAFVFVVGYLILLVMVLSLLRSARLRLFGH